MRFNVMVLALVAIVIGSALAVTCCISDDADAETYGGICGANLKWEYDTSTGTLTITGNGDMSNYNLGNVPWYDYRTQIRSLSLPIGLTSISYSAFRDCSGLASVTIPNSVISIGDGAFQSCYGLTGRLIIPDSVTYIGDGAFQSCFGLTGRLIIPDSVTYIGDGAFQSCYGFTGRLTIPNSVTSIGNYAFPSCSGLTSVIIPNSVTSIGNCAFSGCYGLTGTLTIPNSVTSIGNCVFQSCYGLTSVIIPNSVTSIGDSAFQSCFGLTSVIIPNSVTSIGIFAFQFCHGLTSVTIPDSVTSISQYAFQSCSGLISVTIGNSVTSIGDSAFQRCFKLVEVCNNSSLIIVMGSTNNGYAGYYAKNIYSSESGFSVLREITVGTDTLNIMKYDNAYYLISWITDGATDIVLPSSFMYDDATVTVYSIYDYCFYSQSDLTSVIMPDSVTSIGDSAFQLCHGLTSVTIGNKVALNQYAFYGITFYAEDGTTPLSQTTSDLAGHSFFGTYNLMIRGGLSLTVSFDPAGGTMGSDSKTVVYGQKYGELPVPVLVGYDFIGWSYDDNVVTSDTLVTSKIDHILTAQWTHAYDDKVGTSSGNSDINEIEIVGIAVAIIVALAVVAYYVTHKNTA